MLLYNLIPPTMTDAVGNPGRSGEANLGIFVSDPLSLRNILLHVHGMSCRSCNACSAPWVAGEVQVAGMAHSAVSGSGAYPVFVERDLLVTSSPTYTLDEVTSARCSMRCLNLFCCSAFPPRLQDGPSYFVANFGDNEEYKNLR